MSDTASDIRSDAVSDTGSGPAEFDMIVEVPQGSRNKYEYDPVIDAIRLDRMLFTSTRYPHDYGFIPGTLAEDGDPLDAMVILDEPTFPGCEIAVRPIAVFWMTDEKGSDAKILMVPARDPRYAGLQDLGDVPEHVTAEIGHFFDIYKELERDKGTDVRGWQDRAAAETIIVESLARAAEDRATEDEATEDEAADEASAED
jgi:inorganic pyrophosphatase